MRYTYHCIGDPRIGKSFLIVLDGQTMLWRSVPPGERLAQPRLLRMLGENRKRKEFLILPDGTAQVDEPVESVVQNLAVESGPPVI